MMDFEAWWKKQDGIALRMAAPETIAKAAWDAGSESMKKECIEVVKGQIVTGKKHTGPFCGATIEMASETILGAIKKL